MPAACVFFRQPSFFVFFKKILFFVGLFKNQFVSCTWFWSIASNLAEMWLNPNELLKKYISFFAWGNISRSLFCFILSLSYFLFPWGTKQTINQVSYADCWDLWNIAEWQNVSKFFKSEGLSRPSSASLAPITIPRHSEKGESYIKKTVTMIQYP